MFIFDQKRDKSKNLGHLEECEYAPVYCPNSPNCDPLIRRDLDEHIKKCTQKKCLNFAKDAVFLIGSKRL